MSRRAKPNPEIDNYVEKFVLEENLISKYQIARRGKGKHNQRARQCRNSGQLIQVNKMFRAANKGW